MAAPVDAARIATNIATAATSHNINVNSPAAGTLLLVLMRFPNDPGTVTFTGYTLLITDASDASDDVTKTYYRQADGTEGATDVLSCTTSSKVGAICWGITGAENPATQPPEVGAVNIRATPNTPPSGSVVPTGGPKDFLYVAQLGQDGETNQSGGPGSFAINLTQANSGTTGATNLNVIVAGATIQALASSTSVGSGLAGWPSGNSATGVTTWVVAVHPPAAASTVIPVGFAVGRDY